MIINNTFLIGNFLGVLSTSTYNDFGNALSLSDEFLGLVPSYNKVSLCSDFLKYDLAGETLDDIIYEIAKFDDLVYAEMLKDLNSTVQSHKGSHETCELIVASLGAGPCFRNSFISVYLQGNSTANAFEQSIIVRCSNELRELNISNLENYPMSEKKFTERAKLLFCNINFHDDFETTLSTVKSGDFKLYSIEFTRALRSLHNAVPNLSDTGNNQQDLITIRNETAIAGRTMGCTVQGSNKQGLCNKSFDIYDHQGNLHSLKNLNCEYHLKIDFDNTGSKLNHDLYNRAYFGLPLLAGKKYIALLHLGKHYD